MATAWGDAASGTSATIGFLAWGARIDTVFPALLATYRRRSWGPAVSSVGRAAAALIVGSRLPWERHSTAAIRSAGQRPRLPRICISCGVLSVPVVLVFRPDFALSPLSPFCAEECHPS